MARIHHRRHPRQPRCRHRVMMNQMIVAVKHIRAVLFQLPGDLKDSPGRTCPDLYETQSPEYRTIPPVRRKRLSDPNSK